MGIELRERKIQTNKEEHYNINKEVTLHKAFINRSAVV